MLTKNEKRDLRNQPQTGTPVKYFYAVRRVGKKDDQWPAYQVELVGTQYDRVVKREFIGKPDTLQMALSVAYDLMDPLQEEPVNEVTTMA